MKTFALFVFAVLPTFAQAQSCPVTLAQLRKMNECELTRLFESAAPGELPTGYGRGHVIRMTDAKLPRVQARAFGLAWKGKHFEADGAFINQFAGFKALPGNVELGASSHDGKPCIVTQYPPGTPVFGNTWDELRQVAPGLYLARLYERCPCPRFRGYFAIELACR